jgi:hypothetical protein
MRRKTNPKPNHYQAGILSLIAQSFMIRTKNEGVPDEFSTNTGVTIPRLTAELLIRNGWVRAQRDSMFDLVPQRYDALTP